MCPWNVAKSAKSAKSAKTFAKSDRNRKFDIPHEKVIRMAKE